MSSLKVVEVGSYMNIKKLYPEFLRVYHKSVLSPTSVRWKELRIVGKVVKNIQDEDSFYTFMKVARHVHGAKFFIAFLLKYLELKNPDLLPQAVEIAVKRPIDIPAYALTIKSKFNRLPGEYLTQLMQDKFYRFPENTITTIQYYKVDDPEVAEWIKKNFGVEVNKKVPHILISNTRDKEVAKHIFESQYSGAVKLAFAYSRKGWLSTQTISAFKHIFEFPYHRANFEVPLLILFAHYWALRKFAGSIYHQSQKDKRKKAYLDKVYELSDIIGRLIHMRIEGINETGLVKDMNSLILNVAPLPRPLEYDSKFNYYSDEVLAAIAVAVSQEPERIRMISDKTYELALSEKDKKILTERSQLRHATLFKSLVLQMKTTRNENIDRELKVDIVDDTLVLSPEFKTFADFVSKVKFRAPAALFTYVPSPAHQTGPNLYIGFSPKVVDYLMHVLPHK